ncbi:MAG: SDR family oxidoreductase [Burkholderiales bacterium]|nr:SDR family oxidoreductase [Burkholderiales bacterium]MDE2395754.1 SDR family oxidoreductase [Burkholderiales bacterium]MDE2454040.1 SDR family oxidoreductase [Burkholderiales bacterium]
MSLAQLQDLHGRVALVTGGSRGLGLQMAEALGELGARVVITARKADELAQAKARLEAQDIEVLPIACDLGVLRNIPHLVTEVLAACGPVDVLVNNAGIAWGAATAEHTLEAWEKVMNLNVSALFVACQEVGRRCMLPRRKGKIINIASIQGLSGGYPQGSPTIAYSASKGAVVNLTRMLAKEWAAYDINVNAIAPGFFETRMTQYIMDKQHEQTAALAPLGRTGGPEDLKGVAALLASDAGAFITGQIIAVDGGLTAAF